MDTPPLSTPPSTGAGYTGSAGGATDTGSAGGATDVGSASAAGALGSGYSSTDVPNSSPTSADGLQSPNSNGDLTDEQVSELNGIANTVTADIYGIGALLQKLMQEIRNTSKASKAASVQAETESGLAAVREARNNASETRDGSRLSAATKIASNTAGAMVSVKAVKDTTLGGKTTADANERLKQAELQRESALKPAEGAPPGAGPSAPDTVVEMDAAIKAAKEAQHAGAALTAQGQAGNNLSMSTNGIGSVGDIIAAENTYDAAMADAEGKKQGTLGQAAAAVGEQAASTAEDAQRLIDAVRDMTKTISEGNADAIRRTFA